MSQIGKVSTISCSEYTIETVTEDSTLQRVLTMSHRMIILSESARDPSTCLFVIDKLVKNCRNRGIMPRVHWKNMYDTAGTEQYISPNDFCSSI